MLYAFIPGETVDQTQEYLTSRTEASAFRYATFELET